MRVTINPLSKFCGTRTDPAAETKSIGLAADARGVMVFAILSWQIHHNQTVIVYLSGLSTVKTNYRDPWLFYRLPGLAKTTPPRRCRQLTKPPGHWHIYLWLWDLAPRAVLIKLYLNNLNSALLPGPALARQTIGLPAVNRKFCYLINNTAFYRDSPITRRKNMC